MRKDDHLIMEKLESHRRNLTVSGGSDKVKGSVNVSTKEISDLLKMPKDVYDYYKKKKSKAEEAENVVDKASKLADLSSLLVNLKRKIELNEETPTAFPSEELKQDVDKAVEILKHLEYTNSEEEDVGILSGPLNAAQKIQQLNNNSL